MPPAELDPLTDCDVECEELGDAANSPAWTVAGSPARRTAPTVVQ